jgi:Flp pilus assembly pilin Flp
MKKWLRNSKSGQALVEYALVLALIAVVAILVIKALGTKTTSTFDNIQGQMSSQGVMSSAPTAPQ